MVTSTDEEFLLYVTTHYNSILNTSKPFGEYIEFKNRYYELISKRPLDISKCNNF